MGIQFEIQNEIATIIFDREKQRNALSRAMIESILSAIDEISKSNARLTVISAKGPVFCAGMDLKEMEARAQSADPDSEYQLDSQLYRDMLVGIFRLSMPTLVILQGPVLAGGVGIVLACDLVLASDTSYFSLPEPRRGITASIVTPFLTYRAGVGAASYLLLSGKRVTAEQALRMNLCHQVVQANELESAQLDLQKSILTGSPNALALTKSHLMHCSPNRVEKLIDDSISISAKARESDEAKEGLAAFREKRNPAWMKE